MWTKKLSNLLGARRCLCTKSAGRRAPALRQHHVALLILSAATWASRAAAAPMPAPVVEPCSAVQVGGVLTSALGLRWNQGSARVWDVHGQFWSTPYHGDLRRLGNVLREQLKEKCLVEVADLGAYSVRIAPSNELSAKQAATNFFARAPTPMHGPELPMSPASLLSAAGAVLGSFAPGKGELILLLYSANIAAAIARGEGKSEQRRFAETIKVIPQELDIEYNFGGIVVAIAGGVKQMSMREAADLVMRDVRGLGYEPLPTSKPAETSFDGVFAPEHHESFWTKPNGVMRVELAKIKGGRVRVSLNETREAGNSNGGISLP